MVTDALDAKPKPIGRPPNATLPAVDFAALVGRYTNPGYGDLEFCLFPAPSSASSECQGMDEHLPGILDPSVPTLVAKWDRLWSSHLKLAHYDGSIFNASTHTSLVSLLSVLVVEILT